MKIDEELLIEALVKNKIDKPTIKNILIQCEFEFEDSYDIEFFAEQGLLDLAFELGDKSLIKSFLTEWKSESDGEIMDWLPTSFVWKDAASIAEDGDCETIKNIFTKLGCSYIFEQDILQPNGCYDAFDIELLYECHYDAIQFLGGLDIVIQLLDIYGKQHGWYKAEADDLRNIWYYRSKLELADWFKCMSSTSITSIVKYHGGKDSMFHFTEKDLLKFLANRFGEKYELDESLDTAELVEIAVEFLGFKKL